MSKVKKVLAMLLTLAMVMGMTLTTFAAKTGATINVSGLATNAAQIVKIYELYRLDANNNLWLPKDDKVEEILNDGTGKPVTEPTSTMLTELKTWAGAQTVSATKTTELVTGTNNYSGRVSFSDSDVSGGLQAGAYLVLITDTSNKTTYATMIAKTYAYDNTTNLIEAATANVVAKAENSHTDKSSDDPDKIVSVGQNVTFTVKAVVPYNVNTFSITDTLKGANYNFTATGGWSVTLDGTPLEIGAPTVNNGGAEGTKTFTLNLDSLVNNNNNDNAGKEVVLTYKATVLAVDEVTNTAKASNDSTDGSTVRQYTGEATILKTDDAKNESDRKPLSGAQFAIQNSEGQYATIDGNGYITGTWTAFPTDGTDDQKAAFWVDKVVTTGTDGRATVKGLEAGTYYFKEIIAPDGYSINTDLKEVTIAVTTGKDVDDGRTEYVTMGYNNMTDTKLNSLPSTGGIGTTIFTIGGCVIMIAAAGLFFASRRKSAEK